MPASQSITVGVFLSQSGVPSFHDITEGSKFTPDTVCGYLCTAEPGYDGPTGLDAPIGSGGF